MAAWMVMVKLADHANDDGVCWPSQTTIAARTGLSRQTVNKVINELERRGMLRKVQQKTRRGCVYQLQFEADIKETVPQRSQEDVKYVDTLPVEAVKHVDTLSVEDVKHVDILPAEAVKHVDTEPSVLESSRRIEPSFLVDFSQNADHTTQAETRTPNGVPTKEKKTDPSRGTRLPDPFFLTAEMRTWADEHGITPTLDLTFETERFADYWRSAAGAKGRKTDWTATWRNWMRTAFERAQRYNNRENNGQTKRFAFKTAGERQDENFAKLLDAFATDPDFGFVTTDNADGR